MDDKVFSLNSRVCRICPSEEFLLDLYNPLNVEARNVLNLFIDVEDEISTKLPKFICEECKTTVESIVEFRDKCKARDYELRGKIPILHLGDFKNPIKVEQQTENQITENLPIEQVTVKEEEFLVKYLEDDEDEDEDEEEDESIEEGKVKKALKKNVQPKKTENPCAYCDKVYLTRAELIEHRNENHRQCPICLRIFDNFPKMLKHKSNSHADEAHCHICGKYFKRKTNLAPHIRRAHNNERNHKCDICGKNFFRSFELNQHLSSHNEILSEICDFESCGKAFKSVRHLNVHKKNSHFPSPTKNTEGEPKLCTETTKSTSSRPPSKYKPKTVICQICGKILKTTDGYKVHMRIHGNEKPFECKTCNRMFNDKSTLRNHERIHQDIRPYQCKQCPKNFKTSGILKNHVTSIHETEMKHECHICGKKTKMKFNLVLHMKTHGIGKFKDDLE